MQKNTADRGKMSNVFVYSYLPLVHLLSSNHYRSDLVVDDLQPFFIAYKIIKHSNNYSYYKVVT